MGQTTIYPSLIRIIDRRESYRDTTITGDTLSNTSSDPYGYLNRNALIKFDLPSTLLHKTNIYVSFGLWCLDDPLNNTGSVTIAALSETFGENVTYNTKPSELSNAGAKYKITPNRSYGGPYISPIYKVANRTGVVGNETGIDYLRAVFSFGIVTSGNRNFYTSLTTHPPYIILTYDDADVLPTVSGSPTSGWMLKTAANTFQWAMSQPQLTLGSYTMTGSAFKWKATTAADYTSVDVGTATEYIVPANTFTTDAILWQPVITLDSGDTITTAAPYQVTTSEPTGYSYLVSPLNTVEDGSQPILLDWTYSNASGLQPSGADIYVQYESDETAQELAHVDGPQTYYSVPGGTLTPGTVYWWVRSYNQENAVGSWSSRGQFLNVAAPSAPSVTSDDKPFTTFNWQVSGQEAWRLTVDGVDYGTHFGTEKTFTLPEPLEDGQHTAQVAVQGTYGLWSAPGEVVFTVSNAGTGTLELSAAFGIDADLVWTFDGDDFLVYRDGSLIGVTSQNTYSDRLSQGIHSYYVLRRLSGGYYLKSNTVTGSTGTEATVISSAEAFTGWVPLRLSASSDDVQRFSWARTVSLRHITACDYPVAERSRYLNASGSYNTAFLDAAEAAAFEALRGQVVIIKSRGGNVLAGVLSKLQKDVGNMYTSYSFQLDRIHWEGLADD